MSFNGQIVYGVTGHRSVDNDQDMKRAAEKVAKMACDENAILSIGGANGWDLEVMHQCTMFQVQYILRLAFRSRLLLLKEAFTNKRTCVLITWEAKKWKTKADDHFYFERNKKIIKDALNSSGFYKKVNAYWDHRRAGGTFKTVERALKSRVLVVNWYDMSTLRNISDLKRV